MPIDIKWIRNNPDHVRAWQERRRLSVEFVEKVIDYDNQCRSLLKDVNRQRSELKNLQKALRPSVMSDPEQRTELLRQRKAQEDLIRQTEAAWKNASSLTIQAFWHVASPVDENIVDSYGALKEISQVRKKFPKFDFSRGAGLDVAQAITAMVRQSFGKYTVHKYPSTVNQEGNDMRSLKPDSAHAMFGCAPSGCTICSGSFVLPSWLGLIDARFQTKSIFGTKQLPRFISIWGTADGNDSAIVTDTFHVIAMCAGTMWDSRTIQQQLAEELKEFYQEMLCNRNTTTEITVRALPASDLEMHEVSRIVLLTHDSIILGSVSNFGDAASRAKEIVFDGGGRQNKKDYVHFVQATVLSSDSIATILNENIQGDSVVLPKSLHPFLLSTETNQEQSAVDTLSIPLKSLLKQDELFEKASVLPQQTVSKSGELARLLGGVAKPPMENRVKLEALSCPFEFLFSQ